MNKILVIEDDASVRSSLIELLNEEGFDTYDAENGRLGIEKAKEIYPDLIISDILMPEVDGYGVLEEMQKDPATSSIPFIFLSARTEPTDIRAGMNIGADDYLTKPYKADDLLSAVRSRLQKKNVSEQKLNDIFKSISMSLPHELRTPLIAVIGYSQIIKEDLHDLKPDDVYDMAERINSSGYELLRLVEKFLIYSRMEVLGALHKKYDIINGSHIDDVDNLISQLATEHAEKQNRLNDLKLELTEASIKMSEDHFRVLISELIENAFKFSKQGDAIEITSVVDDTFCEINIKDNGIGMTGSQINEIGTLRQFDRQKNCQTGTGLGLSIVHKIAEIYKTGIKIESEPGVSTTVKVFIPIKHII